MTPPNGGPNAIGGRLLHSLGYLGGHVIAGGAGRLRLALTTLLAGRMHQQTLHEEVPERPQDQEGDADAPDQRHMTRQRLGDGGPIEFDDDQKFGDNDAADDPTLASEAFTVPAEGERRGVKISAL